MLLFIRYMPKFLKLDQVNLEANLYFLLGRGGFWEGWESNPGQLGPEASLLTNVQCC